MKLPNLEIVGLVLLVGVGAYLAGSITSPLYRAERHLTKIWQGRAGFLQKEMARAEEEKLNTDPIHVFLASNGLESLEPVIRPFAESFIKNYLSDPKKLESLLGKVMGKAESESNSTILA